MNKRIGKINLMYIHISRSLRNIHTSVNSKKAVVLSVRSTDIGDEYFK